VSNTPDDAQRQCLAARRRQAGATGSRDHSQHRLTAPAVAAASPATGSWPSFRGVTAAGAADGQNLPDTWSQDVARNILWRTEIPGLGHSSPIVWGSTVFVATAVSSRTDASFKPGLYGDGDASEDRSKHQWKLIAIDKKAGAIRWERVAAEGTPLDKRHIKSTYASATPATDGRIVVASFGSIGLHAFDVNGNFRWKIDYGRINLGAYDLPAFEWGPASSPIIWNDLVIIQVDNHTDSFLLAVRADTGEPCGRRIGRVAVLGHADGRDHRGRSGARDQRLQLRARVRSAHGQGTVADRKSSKITAPTPIFADGVFVVASGRAPERPSSSSGPPRRATSLWPTGRTSNDAVAWSKTARGPYMPTPIAYRGVLYVLANGGTLDAYDLQTGAEVYRQRLPLVGNGYSASPVAADGKIYLSNEDGDMLVITAGPTFAVVATNTMGDLLMATPALSQGVMYVKTLHGLVAIGRRADPAR
jgi:outer membrane protein assembly factor BamB